jgi:transcriptional regulator
VDTLRDHADALSARFEAGLLPKTPWESQKMTDGVMDRMMRMILPFRLTLTGIDGTWKLNQNKPAGARHAAADALAARGGEPDTTALARLMRQAD